MTFRDIADTASLVFLCLALVTFFVLLWVPAPYGRHARPGWGPAMNATAGWMVMETPASLIMAYGSFSGRAWEAAPAIAWFVLWEIHYGYRAFFYPWTLRGRGRPMPVAVVGMGFLFNVINASLQGMALFVDRPLREAAWCLDPRFLAGAVLFLLGLVLNWQSDATLRRLRAERAGYHIPVGGAFRYISCPNYLGEIIEWCGWALATWTLAGLAFATWTAANLVPRALSHHRWYRVHFPEYPRDRKALIPKIL